MKSVLLVAAALAALCGYFPLETRAQTTTSVAKVAFLHKIVTENY